MFFFKYSGYVMKRHDPYDKHYPCQKYSTYMFVSPCGFIRLTSVESF